MNYSDPPHAILADHLLLRCIGMEPATLRGEVATRPHGQRCDVTARPPHAALRPAVIGRRGTVRADLRGAGGKSSASFPSAASFPVRVPRTSVAQRREEKPLGPFFSPLPFFLFFRETFFPTARLPCFKLCSQSIAPTRETKRTCTRRETPKTD